LTAPTSEFDLGRDLRRVRRLGGAAALVLAPIAVGLVRGTIPVEKPGSAATGSETIDTIVRHASAQRLTIVFGVIAALLLPLAMITLARLVSRRTPVLGAVGGGLAIAGWGMVPVLVTLDVLGYELSGLGDTATTAQIWDRVQGNAAIGVFTAVFVAGHVLGMLLLAVGLYRGRWVPAWAAVAIVVGDLIHPAGAFSASRPIEVAAFALVVIGLVPAAAALTRLDDDAWDLPATEHDVRQLSLNGSPR
jgi:hypothetical protein